jgi:hypothetical protein
MSPSRRLRAAVSVCFATVLATPVRAQVRLRPAGVDLGFGLGSGQDGGIRDTRVGLSAATVVAWRARSLPYGTLLVAATLSGQVVIDGSDDCLIIGGTNRCAPNFPGFVTLGALGGWEARSGERGATVRALLGPALFRSGEDATGAGITGRLDLATPAVAHVAFIVWGQHAIAPQLRHESYRLSAAGIGLRLR